MNTFRYLLIIAGMTCSTLATTQTLKQYDFDGDTLDVLSYSKET